MKPQKNTSPKCPPIRYFRTQPLLSVCVLSLVALGLCLNAHSQEQSTRPQFSQASDAKSKVRTGARVAILLKGNDDLLTNLLEDSVSIQLANSGFEVVSRELLETTLAKRTAAKPDQGRDLAVGTLDLAKALDADLVVTGNAVMSLSDTHPVLVKAASFQVLDAGSGKFLVQAVFDTKDELRITEVSRSFLDVLNASKK